MKFFNSFYKYGLVAKVFHWVTFMLLLLQFPLGLYLVSMDFSETRINLEQFHIFFGIIIFYITALLYACGVLMYYFLIRDFERRVKR